MAFAVDEFPFSSEYNSDLRAVLKYMREFETKLDGYDTVIAELTAALEEIEDVNEAIAALQNATADLSTIRANISTLQTTVYNLNNVDAELQSQIDILRNSIANIDDLINNVYSYVDSSVAMARSSAKRDFLNLQILINTINEELMDAIEVLDNKLEQVLANISYDVFNPIRHERITFDENNKQAYVDLRDTGMSYGELSARQFTYGYIRDAKWAQRIFNTKGRRYVTHSDTNLLSPISGRWTNWAEALSYAVGFILGTINYGELAEENLTYSQLSAFTYADVMRFSNRENLTYGDLAQTTINGKNLIGF